MRISVYLEFVLGCLAVITIILMVIAGFENFGSNAADRVARLEFQRVVDVIAQRKDIPDQLYFGLAKGENLPPFLSQLELPNNIVINYFLRLRGIGDDPGEGLTVIALESKYGQKIFRYWRLSGRSYAQEITKGGTNVSASFHDLFAESVEEEGQ